MISSIVISSLLAATLFTVSGTPKTECVLSRWSSDFKTSEDLTRWKGDCTMHLSKDASVIYIEATRTLVDLKTNTPTELGKYPLAPHTVWVTEANKVRFVGLTEQNDEKGFRWKGKVYAPPAELYGIMQQSRLAHVYEWSDGAWTEIETKSIEYDIGGVIARGMFQPLESVPKEPWPKQRVLTTEEASALPQLEKGTAWTTEDEVVAFAVYGNDFCGSTPPVAVKTTKSGWKELVIKSKPGAEPECIGAQPLDGVVLVNSSLEGALFSLTTGARVWTRPSKTRATLLR